MQELADVIQSGGYAELLQALGELNDRQRKSAANWFLAQWKDRAKAAPHPQVREEPLALWMRCLVGLTATAPDPKKALTIPVHHHSVEWGSAWAPVDWLSPVSAEAVAALAQAAINRGAEWCAQYLDLVADARKPRPMPADVPLLIKQAHGLSLPVTPVIPMTWATRFFQWLPTEPRGDAEPAYQRSVHRFELSRAGDRWTVTGRDESVSRSIDAVRSGQETEAMLLALLDHRDAINGLVGRYGGQYAMDRATEVLAELMADGTLDADRLARRIIAALSRGDSVSCQRLQTRLLKAAAPDVSLVGEHGQVLASLIASAAGPAAALAQELLRQADSVQPLPDSLFVDACQMAFARKEKGLREFQLAWAGARAAQPALAASAAHGLMAGLLCPDHGVQRGAVAQVERIWPSLEAAPRAALLVEVEASRGLLDAALYRQLWACCTGGAEPPPPLRPARGTPLRTGMTKEPFKPVEDPARLPADVMRALQTYHLAREAVSFERLVGAVHDALQSGRLALARSIGAHLVPQPPFCMLIGERQKIRAEMAYVAYARLEELQQALAAGQPQRFVSTPSWSHGAIAAEHLVDRMAALAAAGQTALPVDLLVALLRTEMCEPDDLARLRAVGTAQALAAADFFAAGGAGQLATRWMVTEPREGRSHWQSHDVAGWVDNDRREVCVALGPVAHPPAIEGAPLAWAAGFGPENAPFASEFDMVADWITPMLPNNAEALAALHLWGFRRAGLEHGTEGGKNVAIRLPLYLAAHGPAGPALHLAVFFAMSANDAPVRLAGSDGMVTLLQQGRWQSALASELMAECLRCGSVKPGRLAASLAQVREAGEVEASWLLVRSAVAAILGASPAPATAADLLALGAELAGELGDTEPIPELAAFVAAIKGKPNKLQAQAQRLQSCLRA